MATLQELVDRLEYAKKCNAQKNIPQTTFRGEHGKGEQWDKRAKELRRRARGKYD